MLVPAKVIIPLLGNPMKGADLLGDRVNYLTQGGASSAEKLRKNNDKDGLLAMISTIKFHLKYFKHQ